MRDSQTPRLAAVILAFAVTAACGGTGDGAPSVATGPSPVSTPPAPSPAPTSSNCALTVTGLPSSVPYQGGRYPFAIALPSGCSWTARPDQPWADVAPGTGQGNGAAVLSMNENTRSDPRTLTVTINSQSFRIVQNIQGCSYTLDPTSLEESGGGGSARVTLTTGAACSWTASASEGWIRVLTTSGVGSATINLELAPNPSDVRHAFLTIAGQRVDVTQRRQQ